MHYDSTLSDRCITMFYEKMLMFYKTMETILCTILYWADTNVSAQLASVLLKVSVPIRTRPFILYPTDQSILPDSRNRTDPTKLQL